MARMAAKAARAMAATLAQGDLAATASEAASTTAVERLSSAPLR